MTGLGDERPAVTPAKRRVLADEVADAIREAIVTGQLDLGERLPEVGLAADLRVSRGPVREALARLSQEGLVQMERHRGATVARLGPDEVHEIYSLRKELEGLATEWFCANGTEEDFEQISLILKSFDNLPRPLVRADVARLDVAFHDSIFQGPTTGGFTKRGYRYARNLPFFSFMAARFAMTMPSHGAKTTRIC